MKVLIYRLLTNSTKVLMTVNSATIRNNRYEGKLVSANVINLSSRYLFKDEVFLLSKGLQFVPTPKHINKAKIKEEIEV